MAIGPLCEGPRIELLGNPRLDDRLPVDAQAECLGIDLKNPKTNHMNAGFTDEERGKMTELLAAGFIDTFRHFYPDTVGA